MYLYGEETHERPTISTILSKFANYNYLPPTQKEEDDGGEAPVKEPGRAGLGTITGVYFPCIQNIFGVILFIRMVWIVGTAGVPAAFVIVFICCSVTFASSISLSAIATNGIVPAGGSYFMISRALGPEFGGAVGVLFFLATAVAGAMYITGAVEILLNYISPEMGLFGDFKVDQSILYHNIRFYGSILLIFSSIIVFIGVRFVSRVAPVALLICLLSIFSIYSGIFINYQGTSDEYCMIGNRILSNKGYKHCTKNASDPDSLWSIFCILHQKGVNESGEVIVGEPRSFEGDIRLQHRDGITHDKLTTHWDCDSYFNNHQTRLVRAVPGIASGVIKDNIQIRFSPKGSLITADEDGECDSN